ncbi:MAG: sulfurtransferase complex subunit TusD [Pseudomonadota bacterium]
MTPLTYALQVQGTLPDSTAALTALRFARAALDAGHRVSRVFFYNGGAAIANDLAVVEQDEPDLAAQWLQLAHVHDIELTVCVAAGQRRGVLGEAERDRYEKSAHSLRAGFAIVGLGELIDAGIHADRLITFPA